MNQLEQLRKLTTVVADTGEIDAIIQYKPQDATTNPSLILKAVGIPQYQHLIEDAKSWSRSKGKTKEEVKSLLIDKLFINFGKEILKHIPGRVSTELPAYLSFDVKGSIEKAKSLIALYESEGIDRKRILIKLASTWEGIIAAKQLEQEGIHCNMTLLFSLVQAQACAEVKATLISPFVGRIRDWYLKKEGVDDFSPSDDPGVKSFKEIYTYYKKFDISTQVMGASFRNKGEVLELAGADFLTISPQLLEELSEDQSTVTKILSPEDAKTVSIERVSIDEKSFRWQLNQNAMATEKLSEGIRKFHQDQEKLAVKLENEYTRK